MPPALWAGQDPDPDKALRVVVTLPGSRKYKIIGADAPVELEHELVKLGFWSEAHARQLVEKKLLSQ